MFADMRRAMGFTLIELVLVMVVISVGLVGLASLFGNTLNGLTTNETVQQAAQYAQECAERVIATRRDLGFDSASITTTMCDPSPNGFARAVTVPATYTGTSTSACPNGATCRDIGITVTKSGLSSSITIMLVSY